MRYIVLVVLLFVTSMLKAQGESESKVKLTIDTFFKGFHNGDTSLMKSVMANALILQTIHNNKEGKDILITEDATKLLMTIAMRPVNQKWNERLLECHINIDGNMANVWTPYEFWYNDKLSHCGANSFQLFNDNGNWKIIYLMDTRRKTGCGQ